MSFRNADSILFTFIKLLYTQVFDVAKLSISTQQQRALSKCKGGIYNALKDTAHLVSLFPIWPNTGCLWSDSHLK